MTSRLGYWIGGGLVLAAIIAAVLWAALSFVSLDNTVDEFVRVPAPGSRTVELEPRKYIVYFEGPGVDAGDRPPILAEIRDARTERAVPVASYGPSVNYAMGGHSGVAAGTVTPPRAGRYAVTARTDADRASGLGVALGESIAGPLVRAIVGALVIGAVLGLAGIGLIVATAIRRNTGRRRA